MGKRKKIVLFLVEGISDKTALGYMLDKLITSENVEFQITCGDITTRDGVNPSNVVGEVVKAIKLFSGDIYRPGNFAEIIHLVDMDGAYIDDSCIQVVKDCKKFLYTEKVIQTDSYEKAAKRNEQKRKNTDKLLSVNKVWKTIPYRMYYMSANLDHVLYDEENLQDELKDLYAEKFRKLYKDNSTGFLKFFKERLGEIPHEYKASWKYIKEGKHSLERGSNFSLFFEGDNEEVVEI